MSAKYFCDKCGKEIPPMGGSEPYLVPSPGGGCRQYIELCEKCEILLSLWLTIPKAGFKKRDLHINLRGLVP